MGNGAQSSQDRHGDKHLVPLLSLNLILLAFFILLNALSEYEEDRTREVIDSVDRAFSGNVETQKVASANSASLGSLPAAENLLEEVGSLFESIIPASRSKQTERARTLRIEVSAAALFRPGEANLRHDRDVLIRRLARAMVRMPGDLLAYDLGVLHGVPAPGTETGTGAGGSAPRHSLEIRRAARLAERLVGQGLPPGALSVGLRPGHPGIIEFAFSVRDRDETAQSPRGVGE